MPAAAPTRSFRRQKEKRAMTAKPSKRPRAAAHKAPQGPRHKAPAKRQAADGAEDPRHWIIVTDHAKAHIYRKTPKGLERIPDVGVHCTHPFPENVGCGSDFLRSLALWLDAAERQNAFERLVLIAPPATLEIIHPLLGQNVHNKLRAALDREVDEITEDEIEDHITEVVWL
jgi:hypothetical protein